MYTIKLDHFEGPFDLLLFFIERDELDIYDIPIAKITADFLNYMHEMEALNIDLASEFILVAAQLMRIKAKMLLPRKPLDEEGNEIDPREELVNRLIEYKKYKAVLSEMRRLEKERQKLKHRAYANTEMKGYLSAALSESEWESLNLYKLMTTFQKMLQRLEDQKQKNVHQIYRYQFTIKEETDILKDKLKKYKKLDFEETFIGCKYRIHAIVIFLAILEMANQKLLKLSQGEGSNNFWLEKIT